MSLKPGDFAPDFSVKNDEGQERTLADFAGKTLVLYFYPKDNTPGCTQEAQDFRDLHRQFEGKDAIIVGISKDSVVSHQKFKEKYGLPYTLFSDPDGIMLAAYGAWGEKVMYGKKITGILRSTVVVGPDGKVARVFPSVKVKGHAQNVLECIAEAH